MNLQVVESTVEIASDDDTGAWHKNTTHPPRPTTEGRFGGDVEVQRVGGVHEAGPAGEHRRPGAAKPVDRRHIENRQQRPKGAVLVQYEGPDELACNFNASCSRLEINVFAMFACDVVSVMH